MRKVFLDDLPRKEGIGALKGKQVIDWKGSFYYKVRFIYDDIEGEVEIHDYDIKKNYLTIKYRDELYLIKSYDSKGELKKAASKIAGHNKRQVEAFKGEQSMGIFESAKELERQSEDLFGVRLIVSGISAVCLGKYNGKTYKGFTFKYVENNE